MLENVRSTKLDLTYGLLSGKINKLRYQHLPQKLMTPWHSAKVINMCPLCKLCSRAFRGKYTLYSHNLYLCKVIRPGYKYYFFIYSKSQFFILNMEVLFLAIWTRSPKSPEMNYNQVLNLWNHSSTLSAHSLQVIAYVKTSHKACKINVMNSRAGVCACKSYYIKRQVVWTSSKTFSKNGLFLYWESCNHQWMSQGKHVPLWPFRLPLWQYLLKVLLK